MIKISHDSPLVVSHVQQGPLDSSVSGDIAAYQPIARNVWVGFNNNCLVHLVHGGEVRGDRISYMTIDPRDTDWVSIETRLDMKPLKQTGLASVVLTAAASSTMRVDVVLRMPQKGGGHVDTPTQRILLVPQLQEIPVQFFLDANMRAGLGANDAYVEPVVIFFLQPRQISVTVSNMTVSPAVAPAEQKKGLMAWLRRPF